MADPNRIGQSDPDPRRPKLLSENRDRRRQDDLRPSPLMEGQPIQPPPNTVWSGPPQIGASDLNPFAGGVGGGMLFDPNDPSHYPQGPFSNQHPRFIPSPSGPLPGIAAPPGAKFTPYTTLDPPASDRFRGRGGFVARGRGHRSPGNPDNDHMRPPGYDDMFM